MLSGAGPSRRTEHLVETHTAKPHAVVDQALIVGRWKILRQATKINTAWELEQGWFPPPGQDPNRTQYSLACGREAREGSLAVGPGAFSLFARQG